MSDTGERVTDGGLGLRQEGVGSRVINLENRESISVSGNLKLLLFVCLCVVLLFVYLYAASRQGFEINVKASNNDQQAYLDYAKQLRDTGFEYVGNRNRMPGFPTLLIPVLDFGKELGDLFLRARVFSISFSAVLLVFVFSTARIFLGTLPAFLLLLCVAFRSYVFRAGYVQCEPAYYAFMYMAFAFSFSSLLRPGFLPVSCAALFHSLAYLFKASSLPSAAFFIVFLTMRALYDFKVGKDKRKLLMPVVAILLFLVPISPHMMTSYEVYGNPFYNYNSSHTMWYDSWEEASSDYSKWADSVGRIHYPEGERMGALQTWEKLGFGGIATRLVDGAGMMLQKSMDSYGWFWQPALLFLLFVPCFFRPHPALPAKRGTWLFAAMYAFFFFATPLALFAWYAPIDDGPRFPLSLHLPLMHLILFLAVRCMAVQTEKGGVLPGRIYRAILMTLILVALADAWVVAFGPPLAESPHAVMFYGGN